jgi:hypothetical protein
VEYFDGFDTETLNSVGMESNNMRHAMVEILWFTYTIIIQMTIPKFRLSFLSILLFFFSPPSPSPSDAQDRCEHVLLSFSKQTNSTEWSPVHSHIPEILFHGRRNLPVISIGYTVGSYTLQADWTTTLKLHAGIKKYIGLTPKSLKAHLERYLI